MWCGGCRPWGWRVTGQGGHFYSHVLGVQDKDQLGMLHPIFHKEEGEGSYQCFGEGIQNLEGREGWDSEWLGAQGWCAHSRAPLTRSWGFHFHLARPAIAGRKDSDAVM